MHHIRPNLPLRLPLVLLLTLSISSPRLILWRSITSVGGTTSLPETAASFSGGGFSNYFPMPAYQAAQVKVYTAGLSASYAGLYNASGRAYPDVAAYGAVEIVNGGASTPVVGTSCSSPIFASVIGLLNDALISAGKPPLGFLNPWLYSTAASALTDITSASNYGCSTSPGFSAKAGWDPVTGLGTPNFAKLKKAAGL
jgi:tripeptidyl-peptidase-1